MSYAATPGFAVSYQLKNKGMVRPNSLLVSRGPMELPLSGFRRAGAPTSFEELAQARLIKIAHWRVPTWLDPFGMLLSQVIVNLLLELGDGVDPVADHQCFEPSLVRGEHNELDKQAGAFVHVCSFWECARAKLPSYRLMGHGAGNTGQKGTKTSLHHRHGLCRLVGAKEAHG